MAYIQVHTGERWQVPLANRKHRGSDLAANATTVRRER